MTQCLFGGYLKARPSLRNVQQETFGSVSTQTLMEYGFHDTCRRTVNFWAEKGAFFATDTRNTHDPFRVAATRYFPSTLQLPLLRVQVTLPFDTVDAIRVSKSFDFGLRVSTFCTKPPTTTLGTTCEAFVVIAPNASTLNIGVAPLERPLTVHVTAVVLHTSTPSEVFTT